MKVRIRKKGLNKDNTTRYCIEYIDERGEFRAISLNPDKVLRILLDSKNKHEITKEI